MKNNLLQSTKAGALALAAAALLFPGATLEAQIFVTNSDSISEYTTSGALVKAKLVKGLDGAEGIAVSGGDLFVVNEKSGTIGEYTTSGVTINASIVSGLSSPTAIAVSGSYLYVGSNDTKYGGYEIGVYTTSGTPVGGSSFTSGGVGDLAASGGLLYGTVSIPMTSLYQTNAGASIVEYGAGGVELGSSASLRTILNGIAVDAGVNMFVTDDSGGILEFIANASNPISGRFASFGAQMIGADGLAVSGDDLFVSNGAAIGEYTTSGATVNASLVSGLSSTGYIAVETGVPDPTNVQAVPEPNTTMLFGVAVVCFCSAVRPRKQARA